MAGDDHGSWLTLAMIMFLTWSILIYGVRMWAKLRVKTVGPDDLAVTLALIFSVIQQGIMYSAVNIGYGKRSESLSAATLDNINKYIYAGHYFYVIGSGLTRVASAFFIEEISHHGPHAKPARILAWVSGAWTLSCLVTVAVRPPYSRPWLAIDGEGVMFTRWLGVEWSGLAVSAAVWLLTIHLIWTLQMQLSRRIIILGVFGFRLLLIPITVMRVHSLVPPFNPDPNYSTIPAAIFTAGALQFAIISTSLTALKPFLAVFRPPVLTYGSQSRGGGVTARSAELAEPYHKLEMFRRVSRRPVDSGESGERCMTIRPPGKALVRNGDGSDEGRPYYGFANKPPRSLASRTADDGASTQTESSGRLLIQKTTEVLVRFTRPRTAQTRGEANTGMDFPAIAPAPADRKPGPPQRIMGYSCQACSRRKVKCDKVAPRCAACRKTGAECVYEAPPPRGGKRLVTRHVLDKLARYEQLLKQHGLLDAAKSGASPSREPVVSGTAKEPISIHWNAVGTQESGAVIADEGKSRYVDGSFWRNIGVGEEQLASDEEEDDQVASQMQPLAVSDPLSDALLGTRQSLASFHPTPDTAMVLWQVYAENIEPIVKILHLPSTRTAIQQTARDPHLATPREECLAFAVYHFAVFSMTDQDCFDKFGQPRTELLSSFHLATRQALVNASFLKTTDLTILQAFVLFLLPSRHTYDAHTHWILTGAAFRIGQRIGLHRDGAALGLPPFETEMRRRLFYPLLSLDGIASQMAGTAVAQPPDAWDVRQPLNVDDDQLWPGMPAAPAEQTGATDMMFRLSRTCIGRAFVKTGSAPRGDGVGGSFAAAEHAEAAIREAERDVEENYLRYCDVVNPLHFLSVALARSGILAMRLRVRLSKMRNKTATDEDKRETLHLALRILEADDAVCTHAAVAARFRWHTQTFFLWGMWDSLTFALNGLCKERDVFPAADVDATWERLAQVYGNHYEMLTSKQTIHVAFRRLTLVAWQARRGGEPPESEPAFVAALREQQEKKRLRREEKAAFSPGVVGEVDTEMMSGPSGASSSESPFDFNIDDADWTFWDGLLHGGMQ